MERPIKIKNNNERKFFVHRNGDEVQQSRSYVKSYFNYTAEKIVPGKYSVETRLYIRKNADILSGIFSLSVRNKNTEKDI